MSDSLQTVLTVVFFFVLLGGLTGVVLLYDRHQRKRNAQREKERVDAIYAKEDAWGRAVCNLLVVGGFTVDDPKGAGILAHLREWGEDTCKSLLQSNFTLGMTQEMVRVVLGSPPKIDNVDISHSGKKERWIYGTPRQDAVYIWFSNGEITRIRRTGES